MGLVVLFIAVMLVGTRGVPVLRHGYRVARGDAGDRAVWLLARCVDRLPEGRAHWGQAMLVELDQTAGVAERWRFSLGCVRTTLRLRATTPAAAVARRTGAAAGVVVGAAWLVFIHPTAGLRAWVAVPLVVALLVPAGVARLVGGRAATWAGLVGGLLTFLALVVNTALRDGRPYDAQLVRDFHHSHAHDLAAYAVRSDLGVAATLLLAIPLLSVALAQLSRARPRSRASGPRDRARALPRD
jgi:uncharacterized membrane protein